VAKIEKILFASIGLSGGGVRDTYTYNFVTKEMENLVARGFDVYFFHEKFDRMKEINGVKCLGGRWYSKVGRCRVIWFALHNLNLLVPALKLDIRRSLWALKINVAISDLVADLGIGVVHSHFLYPMGTGCFFVAKDRNVPVINTLRGAELHDRKDLNYGACREPLYRYFSSLGLKCSAKITAPNREMAKMLIVGRGVFSSRVEVLPNGFEPPENMALVRPEKSRLGLVEFIAVGNLIPLKNHKLLVRALSLVDEKIRRRISLTIVGSGELRAELEAMTEGSDNVKIVGEVDRMSLIDMIGGSDYLLHPSYIEGMPNVVLEALSLGVPCGVSDISAHRMIVKSGENGFFFDSDDEYGLAKIICNITEDREHSDRMRASCILSSKQYSLDKKIDRYLELYMELQSSGDMTKGEV